MSEGRSLARRLAWLTSAGFAAFWLTAVLAMAIVLGIEQDELSDLMLRETAETFRPVLVERYLAGETGALPPPADPRDGDEALVYLLMGPEGQVVLRSDAADAADAGTLTAAPDQQGYSETETHAIYMTETDNAGYAAVFGDPLNERWEAYRDSLLAFLLPMLALLPLAYLIIGWIARAALRPLDAMRGEIAARDEGWLEPIETQGQPAELRAITATLNGLMIRLGRALDAERAFATNAAHELRTPVAVALAQVQRLKVETGTDYSDRIERIEAAFQRMSRLVARLLQLARADAGIGVGSEHHDLRRLLDLVLDDSRHDPKRAPRLRVSLPGTPVQARIDADAFAILAGNLIDNAFQHAPDGSMVEVELSRSALLRVENDGVPLSAADLTGLTRRFRRGPGASPGFGVGLHIADTIARHSGGKLELRSPASGREDGFEAAFQAAT